MQCKRGEKKRISNRVISWMIILTLVLLPLVVPEPALANGVTPVVKQGIGFSVALDSKGRVWVWGKNHRGQLGIGTTTDSSVPVQVTALNDKTVTAIAAGFYHSVALAGDGSVWAWGDGAYGCLGDGDTENRLAPVRVSMPSDVNIVAVAAGYSFSAALDSEGGVWTWGDNDRGQLGIGTTTQSNVPVKVTVLNDKTINAISLGQNHGMALANDGTLWGWGSGTYGGLGLGDTSGHYYPVQVPIPDNRGIAVVSAGTYYTLAAANDGTVWAWGHNHRYQLGNGDNVGRNSPVQISGLTGVTALEAGSYGSMALQDDGTVWTWGLSLERGGWGKYQKTPGKVSGLSDVTAIDQGTTDDYSDWYVLLLAVKNGGTIWSWGNDSTGLQDGRDGDPFVPGQVTGAVIMSADSLTETNLDGAQLTLEITLDSFADSVNATQFTLNNAPVGTSVASSVLSEGKCLLTLAYDNATDFDTNIANFSVTVAEAAVSGENAITSNSLTISAVHEPLVTPDQPLSEANLNGRTLAVAIQTGTFADDTLDIGNFSLNDAPPGMTLAGVEYTSATGCNVTLAYDGSDFDSNIAFSITIAGSEFSDTNPQTTDRIPVTPVLEAAVVTPDEALGAGNLNGRLLSVILANDTFRDSTLDKANFSLNNKPDGLSIGSVFYIDDTHCVVNLTSSGGNIDSDITDFSLTIGGTELTSGGDITSGPLTITAGTTDLSISTDNLPAGTSGSVYRFTLQATGGDGSNTWSALNLPSWLNLDTASGEISGTLEALGSWEITFTVSDAGEQSAEKTLTLRVAEPTGIAKYTLTPAADGSYTSGTTEDGITTMSVNTNVSGLKYFTVNVTPTEAHSGDECMVFVHFRSDEQLNLVVISADFDSVSRGKAGFNVQSGDVVKVYMVDDLTNDENFNPTILQ